MNFLPGWHSGSPGIILPVAFVGSVIADAGVTALPGGMLEGDFVIYGSSSDTGTPVTATGYTQISASAAEAPSYEVAYKFMGASPDANLTIIDWSGSGPLPTVVYVFRNVSLSSPLDVAVVNTNGGPGLPNCGSITPVFPDVVVVAMGFLDDDPQGGAMGLAGYNNVISSDGGGGLNATATSAAGWISVPTPTAVDPPAYTAAASEFWTAVTIALRPKS
jgi:hypothetical protein